MIDAFASRRGTWLSYVGAVSCIAGATAVASWMFARLDVANVIMVYLLAVVLVAAWLGSGPAVVATILAVAAFVYWFVPDYHSFVVADLTYLPTFVVMLFVGLLVSTLTARLREEAIENRDRERRTQALCDLSRELAVAVTADDVAEVVCRNVFSVFDCRCQVLEVTADGRLRGLGGDPSQLALDADAVAAAAGTSREGLQLNHLAAGFARGDLWIVPMLAADEPIGLVCVRGLPVTSPNWPEVGQLLAAFVHTAAIVLHRLMVEARSRLTQQRIDREEMRNVLLSSVSHDFRTPLASITGAVTTLLDDDVQLDAGAHRDLMESIRDSADKLEVQVRNMLDLTRLESGNLQIRRQWHPLDEVVGGAMTRLERLLAARDVVLDVPDDLPLVAIDAVLIEQLLVNLLENAVRHTPPGSPIELTTRCDEGDVVLAVADRGPGIPAAERERVFTKFYRGTGPRPAPGVGLGLTICRAIAALHGGRIWVEDRAGGGARFLVRLPIGGTAPPIEAAPSSPPEHHS